MSDKNRRTLIIAAVGLAVAAAVAYGIMSQETADNVRTKTEEQMKEPAQQQQPATPPAEPAPQTPAAPPAEPAPQQPATPPAETAPQTPPAPPAEPAPQQPAPQQ